MKFKDFKDGFYQKAGDLSMFDHGGINLVKVVLDGLKVKYSSRGDMRCIYFKSPIIIRFNFFLYRLRSMIKGSQVKVPLLELAKKTKRRFLTIDPGGRVLSTPDGIQSMYYGNISPLLDGGNSVAVGEGSKKHADNIDFVIPAYDLISAAQFGALNAGEKKVRTLLRAVQQQIAESDSFSGEELVDIALAFQQFFIQYRIWNRILNVIHPEVAFLWPHYHREGCIYALKEKGIKTIELQHGLIAPEDIFYALPEAVRRVEKNALFADEIWVYGKFWKEQLLKGAGYEADQVKVKGYFPMRPLVSEEEVVKLRERYAGKKIILVTTQTFLDTYFCEYISFLSADLSKRYSDYVILVKLHPSESVEKYKSVSGLGNVGIVTENVELLFRITDLHISIYSTTLFDGLRFGVKGYSIWHDRFSDYISFFRDNQVATVIQPNENPLDIKPGEQVLLPVSYYYEEFHKDNLVE